MGERDDPQLGRRAQSTRAARLMELLGLSEDELCRVLDADPLTLLSGQLEHRPELPILLDLLARGRRARRARRCSGAGCARPGPSGRPIDALLGRDFAALRGRARRSWPSAGSCSAAAADGRGRAVRPHAARPLRRVRSPGVVFNAHYLAYFDVSITELWRAAFGGYQAMLDRGIDMVVAEAQLRFHASARFDDELTPRGRRSRTWAPPASSPATGSLRGELLVEGDAAPRARRPRDADEDADPGLGARRLEPWSSDGEPGSFRRRGSGSRPWATDPESRRASRSPSPPLPRARALLAGPEPRQVVERPRAAAVDRGARPRPSSPPRARRRRPPSAASPRPSWAGGARRRRSSTTAG